MFVLCDVCFVESQQSKFADFIKWRHNSDKLTNVLHHFIIVAFRFFFHRVIPKHCVRLLATVSSFSAKSFKRPEGECASVTITRAFVVVYTRVTHDVFASYMPKEVYHKLPGG